ncbi:MAG: OmpA family protein [Sulfurimonas sp.]|nr:OmpA family protein [Sulfurimonas sp.]
MKIYLLTFIIILLFFGCASEEVKPIVQEKKLVTAKLSSSDAQVTSKKKVANYNRENITEENTTTRVFRECFKTGSISLVKSCKTQIDSFLRKTGLKDKRNIFIEVHTDKAGSYKKNLAISIKRAKHIASSLYYKEYKYSKVYYKGYGETKLIYDDEEVKSNLHNRRVVIKLRPKNFKVDTKKYSLFVKQKEEKNFSKKT